MMRYRITHTTRYNYTEAVPISQNMVHLSPRETSYQTLHKSHLLVHPTPGNISKRLDYFGNWTHYFSIYEAHMGLSIRSTSDISVTPRSVPETTPAWNQVVDQIGAVRDPEWIDAYQFTLESPLVPIGDEHNLPRGTLESIREYAHNSFTDGRPVLDAAIELNQRIHQDFKYDSDATTIQTPLETVWKDRNGVCQDFAHVAAACLRMIGVPARYVSGYLRTYPPPGQPRLVGADASHAWFAVFCGEKGWVDLDPTNNIIVQTDHVAVAWGRDYGDVCPIRGTFIGGGEHTMNVSVDVLPLEESAASST